jgi:hypothetical protein
MLQDINMVQLRPRNMYTKVTIRLLISRNGSCNGVRGGQGWSIYNCTLLLWEGDFQTFVLSSHQNFIFLTLFKLYQLYHHVLKTKKKIVELIYIIGSLILILRLWVQLGVVHFLLRLKESPTISNCNFGDANIFSCYYFLSRRVVVQSLWWDWGSSK